MQIDRRITNGLAWAGALFVVAIPVADFAAKQFAPRSAQAVVVEEASVAPTMPTPSSQRPVADTEIAVAPEAVKPAPAPVQQAVKTEVAAVETPAAPVERIDGADAFDAYLKSGRQVPSYISGLPAQPAATPSAAPTDAVTTASVPAAAQPIAAAPAPKPVTLPTPVSQRPQSVATVTRTPNAQKPLIIDAPAIVVDQGQPVVSAEDLDDWETGPLSDFLARRQGETARSEPAPDYDADGFFLDEGPNRPGQRRFPSAYDSGFYVSP